MGKKEMFAETPPVRFYSFKRTATRFDRGTDVDARRSSQSTDVVPGVVSVNQCQTFQDILAEDKQLISVNVLHSKQVFCK